jgi:DMSO/TMAO reductase YedYZ molybdopterin-dependent catalytic subunit
MANWFAASVNKIATGRKTMPADITRRETLKKGLAATSLLALLPDWAVPALAQGETDVPFTDYPANYKVNGNPDAANRFLDIRKIDGHITPADQFFFIQHYNRPEIDGNSYRLKFTGLVNKPTEFSLADLKAMKSTELMNGYECSGNSGRFFQGLSSCGRFTGVPLSHVLKHVGVGAKAREVVFFGADRGKEDVIFRQDTYKL